MWLAGWQVAELAVHYFITDNKANVVGMVMAGSADFKTELQMSDLFDPRLLVSHSPKSVSHSVPQISQSLSHLVTPVTHSVSHSSHSFSQSGSHSASQSVSLSVCHSVTQSAPPCHLDGSTDRPTDTYDMWSVGGRLTAPNNPSPTNERTQKTVIKTVDVSYGGENGFNQAIELAGETLGSVKLIQVCMHACGKINQQMHSHALTCAHSSPSPHAPRPSLAHPCC